MNSIESALESEKYHVIRELGRGGMGVVYLAEDRLLKRQVALKVLYEHLNRESTFVERFQEEARSVSTLHHPNIVCVHGLERANAVVAIDMEYVDGQSLDRIVAEGPVSPHVAIAIARDVLSGLVICHDIGLIHRDIKPSNILIHRDGTAKLTDFGLATAYATHLESTVRGNTSSNFYMGTPRYMPVAAWEGGTPLPTWDLYSFGVVLYELLSGEVAYPGDNPMAIMKKHLTEPLPSLRTVTEGLSGELTDIVDGLIQVIHAESPMDTNEFLEALRGTPEFAELKESNAVATVPVPRRRYHRKSNVPRGGRRNFAYGAVLMAGIALLSVVLWNRVEAPVVDDNITTLFPVSQGIRITASAVGATSETEDWLMSFDTDENELTILGHSETVLTHMTATSTGDGNWALSGGWAQTILPQSGSFQLGPVNGFLHWENGADTLHANIERIRERDYESSKLSFVGKVTSSKAPNYEFFYALESNTHLQSMLYNELIPRASSWAMGIESMYPALEHSRYDIPFTQDEVTIDGILDEKVWNKQYYRRSGGDIGDLSPFAPRVGPVLQVRWDDTGVRMATRLPSAQPDAIFEIAIQPDFEISLQESGVFQYRIAADNTSALHYLQGGVNEPINYSWNGAAKVDSDSRSVEIEIPRSMLSEEAAVNHHRRWRVNAQWFLELPNGEREILARWGDERITELAHGALFVFTRDVK